MLDIRKYIGCEACLEACTEACAQDVQTIGPRDGIIKKAYALVKEINGYICGEKENGGSNTIYLSPVPFEELNETIEKGKGKPHLKPVKDKEPFVMKSLGIENISSEIGL